MSANHTIFENSVKAAGTAALTTKATNETARQGVLSAAGTAVGFRPGWPSGYSVFAAAVAAVAAQKPIDDAAVEQAKQGIIVNARDLLRFQGEIAP
jgi:hypothetical protein